jgi:ribose 5-phosphate isomerase B
MIYRIAIGADHRGFTLKSKLTTYTGCGLYSIVWQDVGTFTAERTDYPLYAHKVVDLMQTDKADYGIVLCGTGIGAAIAVNRYKGIYAGVVWNEKIATLAKEDDNITVLVLPADFVAEQEAITIVNRWLSSTFKEGRYRQRLNMIDELSS